MCFVSDAPSSSYYVDTEGSQNFPAAESAANLYFGSGTSKEKSGY